MWWCAAALSLAASTGSVPGERPPAQPIYSELHGSEARVQLPDLSRLAKTAMPAVVGVVTTQVAHDGGTRDPMRDLFEHFHGDMPHKGLGTGFVIHREGYILTNAHVVEGAARIEVDVGEENEHYSATVVGRDDATDIALLKIDAPAPLPVLPLGDSDDVSIAEWVMVIGNPFGLSHSVTLGIVSHTGRSDIAPAGRDGYYDFIQTDASINPGNSGGPLVNLRGEAIGIATAINATGQGIGFAVPINMAKDILSQLKEHGRVVRSWMGISVQEMPRDLSQAVGLGSRHGVLVTDVIAGGPAAHSGIKVGDVITSFDGHAVHNAARLRWYASTAGVGRNVALGVRRPGGTERSLRVQLAELPRHEKTGEPPAISQPSTRPPEGPLEPHSEN